MTDALTPTQVAQRLIQLSRMLDACQGELVAADEKAVRARQRHEVTFARALLGSEGSNAETRRAQAVLKTEAEKLDVEIADHLVRSLRTRLQVLRDQVAIAQSMGAALRAEWGAS